MSPEQENIIKDKLLDYEVPFEDKYWKDFQERAKATNTKTTNHNKYYALALVALLSFSFFLVNKNLNKKPSIADLKKDDITDVVTMDQTKDSNHPTNSDHSNTINSHDQTNKKGVASNQVLADQNFADDFNSNNSTVVNQIDNSDIDKNSTIPSNGNKNKYLSSGDFTKKDLKTRAKSNRASQNEIINSSSAITTKGINTVVPNNITIENINSINQNVALNYIDIPNVNSPDNINKQSLASNSSIDNQNLSNLTSSSGNINAISNAIATSQTNTSNISPSNILHGNEKNNVISNSAIEQKINKLVQLDAISSQPPSERSLKNLEKENATQASEDVDWTIEKSKDWEIGVCGGIGLNIPIQQKSDLESTYNINGGGPNLHIGGYFNYFLNKRISLETGFNYKNIPNHFSAAYSLTNDVELIKIDEVSIVQNLHSFEIPMGINIRISYWLSLNTGFSIAYVKASDVFTDLQIENPMNNPNVEDYKYLAQFDNFGIRKFDARVYAGLTFNVSPFVSFRMLMNQGLIDRTNNEYYNSSQYNVHTDYSFSAILRLNRKALK